MVNDHHVDAERKEALTETTDGKGEPTGDPPGEESGPSGLLGRRSVLKLAGASAVAGLVGTKVARAADLSAVDVSQADGYEVWTVPADTNVLVRLGDNETVENVLIDQTAPGANLYFNASNNPSGWAIRNVGWKGIGYVSDIAWGGFHMSLSGDGVVENVFIDNRTSGRGSEIGGALAIRNHSGTIDVSNTFIAGCGNNAFYASNPGKTDSGATGGEGITRFKNCYHRDNTVSQYRIGTPGSRVENCVGVVDDPNGTRGPYPGTNSRRARGVWGRNMPDNAVRNSVMIVDPDDVDPWASYMVDCMPKSIGPEAVLWLNTSRTNPDAPLGSHVRDSGEPARIEGSPGTADLTVNVIGDGGVPLTPEMAASGDRQMPPELSASSGGSGSGGSNTDLERTLTVDGTGSGRTDYRFTVSGELAENPDVGSLGSGDTIDGSSAAGFVNGGVDGYQFSGEILEFDANGDAEIRVDGQAVNPDTLGDPAPTVTTGTATGVTATAATLRGSLDALGEADAADVAMEWREAGTTEWNRTAAETLSAPADVSRVVTGLSAGTAYEYRTVATASDGDTAAGSTVGFDTGDGLGRTLTVDGSGTGRTDYRFTVSGELAENPDVGSLGSGDTIDGSSAAGFVNGGVDGYRFSGDLVDITLDGDATVLVDGEELDAAYTLPNRIVLDGRDYADPANYEFAVSGTLASDPAVGGDDDAGTISGSAATGTVDDDRDAFRFSGDVVSFSIDGNADVTIEDNDG